MSLKRKLKEIPLKRGAQNNNILLYLLIYKQLTVRNYIIIFLGLFLLTACGGTKDRISQKEDPYKFNFEKSSKLSQVLDMAEVQNKLVFVDIYTDWCLPCKLMDEDVFTHQETADFMNEHFVNYKIDAEKNEGPDIQVIYNVQAYPTLLFLDSKGRVIVEKLGAAYQTELIQLAKNALSNSDLGLLD